MSKHHHDHQTDRVSDAGLLWAVAINLLLTVVELVAGILSGSLALIGDAIHNGSDAVALLIALVARRWSRRQPDDRRTYGYRRAAIVGATINLTTLVVIGVYLLYESAMRMVEPTSIDGSVMIIVATVALAVDVATVLLMRAMGTGLNIRAALAHNLADAMASVGVIIAGGAILLWDIAWVDPVLTALIAGYILFQAIGMLRGSIAILMDSAPPGCEPERIAAALNELEAVHGVHHIHLRQLDESYIIFEAHVVVDHDEAEVLHQHKDQIRALLHDRFDIQHVTLDFEFTGVERNHDDHLVIGGH